MVLPVGALTTTMPGPRRRVEIDVVDADARPADDHQAAAGGDELGVDLDLAAHDERVVVGQQGGVIGSAETGPLVDFVVRPQELDALRRDRLGDQDPHAPTGASAPMASSAARWAAATAAPASTGRPCSSETSSMTPIASRISASVTEPRWPSRKMCPESLP